MLADLRVYRPAQQVQYRLKKSFLNKRMAPDSVSGLRIPSQGPMFDIVVMMSLLSSHGTFLLGMVVQRLFEFKGGP